VDANHLSRAFQVTPSLTVTIEGLRIVNGRAGIGAASIMTTRRSP
jgi:hypothetical protein